MSKAGLPSITPSHFHPAPTPCILFPFFLLPLFVCSACFFHSSQDRSKNPLKAGCVAHSVHAMARSPSKGQRGELEDLVNGPSGHRMAVRALKSYVKDLDSNTLPAFLARVCDPDKPSSFSEEGTLCLFEIVARIHGPNIMPHISNMVSAVIRIMSLSSEPFLHNFECSNVVRAISWYGIDPLATEEEKASIISSLCRPLSDCLMNIKESITSGSALCLIALVESNNWQFASSELINEVCLKVSGALEEAQYQTVAHLGLVIALSKKNPLILEPYGRSLIRSGLQILADSTKEINSQMILPSIQMIDSIMKCSDSRIISSELSSIINAMEQYQDVCVPDISAAAIQALERAKVLARQKRYGNGNGLSPVVNYSGTHSKKESPSFRDNVDIGGNGSSESLSYELQSVQSFADLDMAADSQPSWGQCPSSFGSGHARRRLWSNRFDPSYAMPNDDFLRTAGPDLLAVLGHYNHASPIKLEKKCSDVLGEAVEPCALCLAAQATNQCAQISVQRASSDGIKMQLTPRKQIHSCTFCKDLERDGHRLPKSESLRQIHYSGHSTNNHLLKENSETGERMSYQKLIQQNDHYHIQNNDLLTEDSNSPIDDQHSDSAWKSPHEVCLAKNNKMLMGSIRRNMSSYAAVIFILCVCVVLIAVLLSAWQKGCHKELYEVPT